MAAGTDATVIASTNGRTAARAFLLGWGALVSFALIASSIKWPWLSVLGAASVLALVYAFVCEFFNTREIVVHNGMLTARSVPIPTFERHKTFELEKVRSCEVFAKHYEGTRGVTTCYHVGMSFKDSGKALQHFLRVKSKQEAERIAREIDKALRKIRSNKRMRRRRRSDGWGDG